MEIREVAMEIVKKIQKKCGDPCLALLEYLKTPITIMTYSLIQLLINR